MLPVPASGGDCEFFLFGLFDLGGGCAEEVEGDEEGEGEGGRVARVDEGGDGRGEDRGRGERAAGVGAVD